MEEGDYDGDDKDVTLKMTMVTSDGVDDDQDDEHHDSKRCLHPLDSRSQSLRTRWNP